MGPLDSRPRRTALLALGLVVLAGLLAAPGTADQTERYNESVPPSNASIVMVANDTGDTTVSLINNTGGVVSQITKTVTTSSASLIRSQNIPPTSARVVISTERTGLSIRVGNATISSETGRGHSYVSTIPKGVNATLITQSNTTRTPGFMPVGGINDERVSGETTITAPVDRDDEYQAILVVQNVSTPPPDSKLVREYYNKTISPDGSVEALRVSQTNDVPTERARVVISDSQNGTELVNETIDPRTTVSYGLVEFDSADNYTVTVTGVAGDTAPEYETTRRKTNQPILALGGGEDVPQSARILGIGLVVLALAAVLQHRKDP